MNPTWSSRPATPDDLPQIRDLFTTVFGGERSLDHVRWKFRDNPAGPGIGIVAVDGGRIVGQYVLMPVMLRIGTRVVAGAQSLDTMVHPDYRGQGMFIALATECYALAASRGTQVLYGFPNANSYPGLTGRLAWTHVGDVPRWVRHLDLSKHPRMPSALKPIGRLANRLLPRGRAGRGIDIGSGRPDAVSLSRLLERWRAPTALCRIERTPDWYDWRFAAASGGGYEWLTAWRGGEARAALVISHAAGAIAELLGDDEEALEALVAAVVRRAAEGGGATMSAMTNDAPAVAALKACGFFPRAKIPLIVRALTDQSFPVDIMQSANWSIRPADFDTV